MVVISWKMKGYHKTCLFCFLWLHAAAGRSGQETFWKFLSNMFFLGKMKRYQFTSHQKIVL